MKSLRAGQKKGGRRRSIAHKGPSQRFTHLVGEAFFAFEHRSMDPHQTRFAPLPEQQGGDVAVANQGVSSLPEELRIEAVQEATAPIAAPGTNHCIDIGSRDQLVQFSRPAGILASQVARSIREILATDGLETEAAQRRFPRFQTIRVNDPRRRSNAHSGAGSKGTSLQGSAQRPPHVSLGGKGFRVAAQYMNGWQARRVPNRSEGIFLVEFSDAAEAGR